MPRRLPSQRRHRLLRLPCSRPRTATLLFGRLRRSRRCSRITILRSASSTSRRRRKTSSRSRPNVPRSASLGCRGWRNYRCQRRMKSDRPGARLTESIRRRIGCHSCNVWPMLASAGAIRTPSLLSRVARPGQPWLRCLHCRSAGRSAALPSRWVTSRYQSTRAVRRLKDWILTAVRFPLRPLRKAMITWISPLFFAARPTEVCNN